MNLLERLLPATGRRGRTSKAWTAMEQRVAHMDDQDRLLADLTQQRDQAEAMAAAATAQVEDFRARVTAAETAAAQARAEAEQAQTEAIRLRAENANLSAITVPMYPADADTQELHLPPVMSLQARGAA